MSDTAQLAAGRFIFKPAVRDPFHLVTVMDRHDDHGAAYGKKKKASARKRRLDDERFCHRTGRIEGHGLLWK